MTGDDNYLGEYVPEEVTLDSFKLELVVEKDTLKNELPLSKYDIDGLMDEILGRCTDSLVDYLMSEDPHASSEFVRDFIKVYINFEITMDYDIRTLTNTVTVKPRWKEFNEIDFNQVKILDDEYREEIYD